MRARRHIAVILMVGLCSYAPLASSVQAAQSKDERGSGSRPGEKRQESNGTQWSADPDRGWIRTDERQEPEKKPDQKPNQPSGKDKEGKRK